MTKVLMVCLGNICRSPLAEGILKSKVFSFKTFVDSAGTGAYHVGEKPDKRSILVAEENGINISDQKARKFSVSDFDNFDIIYAMDNSNYDNILKLARSESDKSKVKLILNEVFPNENLDVPDPYYGGNYGFKNVFNMLNQACDVIAEKINSNE
jgi:protein-tyrosine phosphatase